MRQLNEATTVNKNKRVVREKSEMKTHIIDIIERAIEEKTRVQEEKEEEEEEKGVSLHDDKRLSEVGEILSDRIRAKTLRIVAKGRERFSNQTISQTQF